MPSNRSRTVPEVDRSQVGEPGRSRVERSALGGGAERGQKPGAAVVGAGASQPDDDPLRAGRERVVEQLAEPAGVGVLGLAVLGLGEVQTDGLGALDVRRPVDHEHRGGGGLAVRTGHRDGVQVATERRVQHVDEARAAVRHRHLHELVAR